MNDKRHFNLIEKVLLGFGGAYALITIAAYSAMSTNPNIGQKMALPALASAIFIIFGMAFHLRGERIEQETGRTKSLKPLVMIFAALTVFLISIFYAIGVDSKLF